MSISDRARPALLLQQVWAASVCHSVQRREGHQCKPAVKIWEKNKKLSLLRPSNRNDSMMMAHVLPTKITL